MPKNQIWTVLSRPECGLCEEFVHELQQLLVARASSASSIAVDVQVIDVDSDAEWLRKYGNRIPVLLADGDYVCDIRLDVERVRRLLSSPL